MDSRSDQARNADTGRKGKRKYEAPEIMSEEVFETTALACRKMGGSGGQCNAFPKS